MLRTFLALYLAALVSAQMMDFMKPKEKRIHPDCDPEKPVLS